jgi:2-C-methyl-D-erythritol 2,4-cyclodiphosphate synthase
MIKCAIGQDSHRFEPEGSPKPLMLGGISIPGCPGLAGNSDADVVLHALTNAISGVSGVNILGAVSDELCLKQGITDSRVYLARARESLVGWAITHVSLTIEGKRPHLAAHIPSMKASIARLMEIETGDVGITATTGEGLTAFGRGEGVSVFVIVTAQKV